MANEHLLLELIRQGQESLAEDRRELAAHKKECVEERREAKRDRHDFRAEVALGMSEMREEIRDGFGKMNASMAALRERVEKVSDQSHDTELKTWDWRLKAAVWLLGGVAAILLSLAVWALVQWLSFAGVLK